MTATEHGTASEAAQLVSELVRDERAISDAAARDLHRLLSRRLTTPDPGAERWDRLWFLVELLVEREGLVPSANEYERARLERKADAPAASTLSGAYGHWLRAVRAAGRVLARRPQRQLPVRQAPHTRDVPPYTPAEMVAALARFHRRFGTWPTRWEYEQWSRLSRDAARQVGAPHPRLPCTTPFQRVYGSFDRALEAARKVYDRQADAR